jgi:hypothetical protein
MAARGFEVLYARGVEQHLDSIPHKYWPLIRRTIEQQLCHQPGLETRNRKPLTRPPSEGRWELRFGPANCFRVFYRVSATDRRVWVLAIGIKHRDRLLIGGKEIEL